MRLPASFTGNEAWSADAQADEELLLADFGEKLSGAASSVY
jgi:hypothetical protein